MKNKRILIIGIVTNIVLLLAFLIGTSLIKKDAPKDKRVKNLSLEIDITNDGTILVTEDWDIEFLEETNEFYRNIYYHKLEEDNPFIANHEAIGNIATFSTIPNTYNQRLLKDNEELEIEKGYSFNHDLDKNGEVIGGINRINLEVFYFQTNDVLMGDYRIQYQYKLEYFITNYLDCNELSLNLIQDPILINQINFKINFPKSISKPFTYSNHQLSSSFLDNSLNIEVSDFYYFDNDNFRIRVLFDQDSLAIANPNQIMSFQAFTDLNNYEALKQETNQTKIAVYISNIVLVLVTIVIMVLVYLYFENIIFKAKVSSKVMLIDDGLLESSLILDGFSRKRHFLGLIKKMELNGNITRENNVLTYKHRNGLSKQETKILNTIFEKQKTIALEKINYSKLKKLATSGSEYEKKPQLILLNFLFIFIFYYIIIYKMEDKLDLDFIWTKILIALTFLVSLVFSLLIRLKKRKKYKEVKAFKNYLEEAKLKDDIYLPYYISYGIIDFK